MAKMVSDAQKQWPAKKIRSTFIDFFVKKHGHTAYAARYVPSSSVVPHEDPTLLFANAGMNQFKSIFLGTVDPKTAMAKLKSAVNSQKCIRAGGKHNDLDDVGKDLYHHTFFEMLGNWSFGNYFKEGAVAMAWECLTVEYGLDPDRLYVTYFGGDAVKAPGVPADEETRQLWLKYLPAEKVLPFDAGDNFWEMGDTGPCGPCTEIHYDRIGGRDAAALVNMDDPNVLEIWNNVFIQYNRDATGLKSLPSQHVDTGMGFERLSSILQGQMSNYDTDIFAPLFAAIHHHSGCPEPYRGRVGEADTGTIDMAYRVVADHVRTLSFAIADGCVPDALGRGYVLRRVLRRAVWYSQRFLGAKAADGPFVAKIVAALVDTLGEAFPELARARETIEAVLEGEERDFNRTIDKGARFFAKKCDALGDDNNNNNSSSKVFSGRDAFHLSGSLGFPLDLTQIMAEERGLTVDVEGYHAALAEEKAKNDAALSKRKAARSGAADMTMAAEQTAALANAGVPKTATDKKYAWFETVEGCEVVALYVGKGGGVKGDGFVGELRGDEAVAGVVLDATSFYAEMGGQTFDTGLLLKSGGDKGGGDDEASREAALFEVDDVQVYGGYVVHVGAASSAAHHHSAPLLKVGDRVACAVDYDRRTKIAPNHTMTHVLNFALREVLLGGAVEAAKAAEGSVAKCVQRGSDVDAERLRFDFSWDAPLETDQLEAVERIVRETIDAALVVDARETKLADAFEVPSLRAMKGEAYPDPVRVVAVGASVDSLIAAPKKGDWNGLSIELCGGTHLRNTRDAVGFALLEETGIAKGVRRIVGVTREAAAAAHGAAMMMRERLAVLEKKPLASEQDVAAVQSEYKLIRLDLDSTTMPAAEKKRGRDALDTFFASVKEAQKKIADDKAKDAEAAFEEAAAAASSTGFAVRRIDFGTDSKLFVKMQKAVFAKKAPDASFCIVSSAGDKFVAFAVCSDAHVKQRGIDAREWCKKATAVAGGGKGGGKPNSANMVVLGAADKIAAVLDAATAFAKLKL